MSVPKFSKRSQDNLYTCQDRLIKLCEELIKIIDFTVLCGHRDKEAQNKAYQEGRSTKQWPNSKHNRFPSPAVDLAPYPIDWEDRERFSWFAGWLMCTANQMSIPIRWGGDWDGDTFTRDHTLSDLPHFELLH